jgi:hypothetical protein
MARSKVYRLAQETRLKASRAKHTNAPLRWDNPTPCSCYMCGNPRRSNLVTKDKLTVQERKALYTLIEETLAA